jgi:hypothetical protein
MQRQAETLTWSDGAMYVVGGLSGAVLGLLAAIWLGSATASASPFFWFVSRASAVVAYLLLWLSTAWGITVSSKGIGGRVSGALAYALHNVTSWLALSKSTRTIRVTYSCRGVVTRRKARAVVVIRLAMLCVPTRSAS